jgi:hypothetical protein
MIWLLPQPFPHSRQQVGGGRARLYDGEKAWFSINHSTLSGNIVRIKVSQKFYKNALCQPVYYYCFGMSKIIPLPHFLWNLKLTCDIFRNDVSLVYDPDTGSLINGKPDDQDTESFVSRNP